MNFIVLMCDTLRRDHLEPWGYQRATGPELVELCRRHGLGRIEVANVAQVAHTMVYLRPQGEAAEQATLALERSRLYEAQRDVAQLEIAESEWVLARRPVVGCRQPELQDPGQPGIEVDRADHERVGALLNQRLKSGIDLVLSARMQDMDRGDECSLCSG